MSAAPGGGRLPVVAFVWEQFGAYHMDRLEAVARAFEGRAHVVGLEIATASAVYDWAPSGEAAGFVKQTLFPGANARDASPWAVCRALRAALRRHGVTHLFVSGYELRSHAMAAALFRLRGGHPVVMLDSKFDDKPRRLPLELFKALLMLPYRGGFAAGRRSQEYLRFLGLRRRPVTAGYDSVSLDRLRALAPAVPVAWGERAFVVVARLVPKKNLGLALAAYAAYRARAGAGARRLRLCGGGPLNADLRAQAAALGIADAVDFLGSVPQDRIAAELSRALCLLLPSVEEQWGLVVNEALAFALPLLVADNVGARDALVRAHVNGFVLSADDPRGWAEAMLALGADEALWQRFTAASAAVAPQADVAAFVAGCAPHILPAPLSR